MVSPTPNDHGPPPGTRDRPSDTDIAARLAARPADVIMRFPPDVVQRKQPHDRRSPPCAKLPPRSRRLQGCTPPQGGGFAAEIRGRGFPPARLERAEVAVLLPLRHLDAVLVPLPPFELDVAREDVLAESPPHQRRARELLGGLVQGAWQR